MGVLSLVGTSGQAQNYLQHKLNKKMRTDANRVVRYLQSHPDATISELKATPIRHIDSRSDDDQVIDATAEAESELHAAINPLDSNNIIISAMRQSPDNILSPLTFPTYYTKDFGQTWELSSFDGTIDDGFVIGGGDPIIVFDTEGVAYICWLTLSTDLTFQTNIALRYAVSKDGGATWVAAAEPLDEGNAGSLVDILGGSLGGDIKFVDKEWLAVDRSDSEFRNTIYASYLTIASEDGENINMDITLRKKGANKERFSTESVYVNSDTYKVVQFTSIDVDSEGIVHVSFAGTLDSLNWSLYYTQSRDGGATFAQEKKVSDFHIPRLSGDEPESNVVGIDGQRLYPCPHLVVDRSEGLYNGNLYMVWTANGLLEKETEGLDIYYARSTDGGSSWSEAYVLNDDGLLDSHQFYPSMAVNELGTLIVSWYDRREDPDNLDTYYYLTYSKDGGATFEPSFPVSTAAADFSLIGSKNGNFGIGEYTQTVASSSYAIPVWADGRTNDGNIDLYVAIVPLEGQEIVSINSLYKDFNIDGPHPNPAVEQSQFSINLATSTTIDIQLFDVSGKSLRTIQNGKLSSGEHTFQVTDLKAGQYYLRIQTNKGIATRPLTVIEQ